MDNLFKTRALTMAVNQMRPAKTPILDRIFRTKRGQTTDRLAWDVMSGTERLLENISIYAPAQVESRLGYTTMTVSAPRFAPKRFIPAASLNAGREFGTEFQTKNIQTEIGRNQLDMKNNIDLTREFLALGAIRGTVLDGGGNTLVDYNFGDNNSFTPDAAWNAESGADIIGDFRAMKKQITDRVQVSEWEVFVASDVMTTMLNDSVLRDWLKNGKGVQIAEDGMINRIAGVGNITEYEGTYLVDDDGDIVRTEMFPAGTVIMVGWSFDAFSEQWAPVIDLESETGVGSGQAADTMFFSKSWEEKDPSGRWVKVEARPLPCVHKLESIVVATVLE